jgi:3-hydroxyisobutyrate dehydrogenase/putative dehydrogenase
MSKVGWIGLGAMGAAMARVVAGAGHSVIAFDVSPGRSAALAGAGVVAAPSAAAAATGADVLAVMVATPAQAASALFGEDGAAASLAAGSVVLMMATVGAAAVTDWSAQLARRGISVVDAPVSGGTARASVGDLVMMVGGAPEDIAKVAPLLDAMASSAPVVGPRPGDGQKLKLVNQLLCGVHIAAAAEALVLAEALGLDAAGSWEVVRQGPAASFMLDDRGRRMVEGAFGDVRGALDIFVKDMGLVVDAARRAQARTALAEAAQQAFQMGAEAGYGRGDDSSVILVYRELLRQQKGSASQA